MPPPASATVETESEPLSIDSTSLSKRERQVAWAGLALLVGLKIVYALHMRIDSDEPQHLHTVWAWANGMLPYRDVFDNHMPLFQFLCSPLFHALGERPDIVSMMRLAMIPLFLGMLWCVYRVVAEIESPRAGLWAMFLTGFCPSFFFVSSEFRTDDLWSLLWLMAGAVLVCGRLSIRNALGFGLLLGLAFAVSMKTSLLLAALVLACLLMSILRMRQERLAGGVLLRYLGAAVGSALTPPLAAAAFFCWKGAWKEFSYCIFQHNVVPGVVEMGGVPAAWRAWYFPAGLPILLGLAWWILRRARHRTTLATLVLATGFYLTMLWSYWPVLSAEDYEPFFPMLFAAATALVCQTSRQRGTDVAIGRRQVAILILIAAADQSWTPLIRHPWRDDTVADVRMVGDVLKLTAPGQMVMDGKGETIYRPRPFYYALETMTDARLAWGLMADDIAQRLIGTGTPVSRLDRLPPLAHAFVKVNYVPVTPRLLVIGKRLPQLGAPASAEPGVFQFEIAVPGRYLAVAGKERVSGAFDGEALAAGRFLAAGRHELRLTAPKADVAVVWADAIEKGYFPVADGR